MPIIKEETTTSSFNSPNTTNNITYGVENPNLALGRAHICGDVCMKSLKIQNGNQKPYIEKEKGQTTYTLLLFKISTDLPMGLNSMCSKFPDDQLTPAIVYPPATD